AKEIVISRAAVDRIVAERAVNRVVTGVAVGEVVATFAVDLVVAVAAAERVVAVEDAVISARLIAVVAEDKVLRAIQQVAVSHQQFVAAPPVHGVAATAAEERIVTGAAVGERGNVRQVRELIVSAEPLEDDLLHRRDAQVVRQPQLLLAVDGEDIFVVVELG